MKLTNEQKKILASTGNIKINAIAGSGKTTTLIEFAKKQPKDKKILYLAFNRSVKLEALEKFDQKGLDNVTIHTPHSLAFRHIVFKNNYSVVNGYKRHEIVEILKINWKGSTGFLIASHIQAYVDLFCNQNCEKVIDLDYLKTIKNKKSLEFAKAFHKEIIDGTRKFLALMEYGKIKITHSFYLKKFQLEKVILPYDIILFDEGQDASPVMLDVFLRQKSKKVIVGDIHQQIYGWRYAVNALQNVDFKEYRLSKSFRFDKGIADLALETLNWKKHLGMNNNNKVEGLGKRKRKIKSRAFIARTNLSLFSKAIEMVFEEKVLKSLYFEGNINSYTYASEGASLFDVLNLYNGKTEFIRDPIVKSMESFSDLCKYADEQSDQELNMIIELIRKYQDNIPWYIKRIRDLHVEDNKKDEAQMIFSTVHRCKGLEYDHVTLADDFISEEKLIKSIQKLDTGEDEEITKEKLNEEINLLYVAITRSSSELKICDSILPEKLSRFKQKNRVSDLSIAFSKTYRLKNKKAHQAGRYWKREDDINLEKMVLKGESVSKIASLLGRSKGAIESRLKKLELDELFFD